MRRTPRPQISRRALLAGGSALLAASLVPRPLAAAAGEPLLLDARPGEAALLGPDGPKTDIWGYGGTVPGPVIRVPQGGIVDARLLNNIGEPTTIHWHGIRIDNRMDGVGHLTQPEVGAGETFDYRFRVPDAGTFWYHPHAHRPMQQARGLYGLLIVEEPAPVRVDRELALLIDDWRLEDDGAIETRSLRSMHDRAHAGRLGNVLTINGLAEARLPVRRHERLRVRVCSPCNARIMALRFEDVAAQLVAIDGQPVDPEPLAEGVLVLGPSQRADLVVDITAAEGRQASITEISRERLVLGSFDVARAAPVRARPLEDEVRLPANPVTPPRPDDDPLRFDLVMGGGAMGMMMGGPRGGMRPGMGPGAQRGMIDGGMFRGERLGTRELVRAGMAWTFNGIAGDPESHDPALFTVEKDRTVVLRMENNTAWPHAMHIHGHHFQVLSQTQGATKPWLHDTVLMSPREEMIIAFTADNPGKWMVHCHMLEHQMSGMQAWFEVMG